MSVAATTALTPTHASPLRRLWALPARTTDYTCNGRSLALVTTTVVRVTVVMAMMAAALASTLLCMATPGVPPSLRCPSLLPWPSPAIRQWSLPLVDVSQLSPRLQATKRTNEIRTNEQCLNDETPHRPVSQCLWYETACADVIWNRV